MPKYNFFVKTPKMGELLDPQLFVHQILTEKNMLKCDPNDVDLLAQEIEAMLLDRMQKTVVSNLSSNALILLKNLMESQPDLHPIEALALTAANIPNLQELMNEAAKDFYEELVALGSVQK